MQAKCDSDGYGSTAAAYAKRHGHAEVEPLLRSLIGGLFAESGLVPPGSVIDAGANRGEEACYYAERQPQRLVPARRACTRAATPRARVR